MIGVDISRELYELSGKEETLEFVVKSSDYNNCVDVSFRFLGDDEQFRGHLTRIPKASIPKLIEALTPFLPEK